MMPAVMTRSQFEAMKAQNAATPASPAVPVVTRSQFDAMKAQAEPPSIIGESLKRLGRDSLRVLETVGGTLVEAAGGAIAGVANTPPQSRSGFPGMGFSPPAAAQEPLPKPMENPFEGQAEMARRVYQSDRPSLDPDPRLAEATYTDLAKKGDARMFVTKLVADTAGIAPSMAATVAGALVGGPAGAAMVGGLLEGANEYDAAKASGKGEAAAQRALVTMAGGTGILNALPFMRVFDRLLPDNLKGKAASLVAGAILEGATETAEGAVAPLAQAEHMPRSKQEWLDLAEKMRAGVVAESGVFLPAMLTGGGAQAVTGKGEGPDTRAAREGWDEMIEAIKAAPDATFTAPQQQEPSVPPQNERQQPQAAQEPTEAPNTQQRAAQAPEDVGAAVGQQLFGAPPVQPTEQPSSAPSSQPYRVGLPEYDVTVAEDDSLVDRVRERLFGRIGGPKVEFMEAAERVPVSEALLYRHNPRVQQAAQEAQARGDEFMPPEFNKHADYNTRTGTVRLAPTASGSEVIHEFLHSILEHGGTLKAGEARALKAGLRNEQGQNWFETDDAGKNAWTEFAIERGIEQFGSAVEPKGVMQRALWNVGQRFKTFADAIGFRNLTPEDVFQRLFRGYGRSMRSQRETGVQGPFFQPATATTAPAQEVIPNGEMQRQGQARQVAPSTVAAVTPTQPSPRNTNTPQERARQEANILRGEDNMRRSITEKVDVLDAMERDDLGSVSFIWGKPGNPSKNYEGGYGVSHIIEKRYAEGADGQAVAQAMVETIASGEKVREWGPEEGKRAEIRHGNHTAILSLHRDGTRQTWLLTGWKEEGPNASGEVYDSARATQPGPSRFRSGLEEPASSITQGEPNAVQGAATPANQTPSRESGATSPTTTAPVPSSAGLSTDTRASVRTFADAGIQDTRASIRVQTPIGEFEADGPYETSVAGNPITIHGVARGVPMTENSAAAFARDVRSAIDRLPESARFGDRKVFIGDVYKEYARRTDVPRPVFNAMLLDANRRGELQLSRADLVQAMDPVQVAESAVYPFGYDPKQQTPEFNFIVSEQPDTRASIRGPRQPVAMPELVQFAREVNEGKYPRVRRSLGAPERLGQFSHNAESGEIEMRADLFKDPEQAARTLSHEIGHLADWLPDKTLKRGNVLGRIASFVKYTMDTLAEHPNAPGQPITEADKARIQQEAELPYDAVQEVISYIEEVAPGIRVTPEDVKAIWMQVGGREKNPRLYQYIANLSEKEKKDIAKKAMRGIVREDVQQNVGGETTVRREVREQRTVSVTPNRRQVLSRFRELLKKEIEDRHLFEEESVRSELKALSEWWRPIPQGAPKPYLRYRASGRERYADFISALLNDPQAAQDRAPTVTRAFFNWLGRKPEVQAQYESIQNAISSGELPQQREQGYQAMLQRGEEKLKGARQRKAEASKKSLHDWMVDIKASLYSRSAVLSPAARQAAKELQYMPATVAQMLREFEGTVRSRLNTQGLTDADLGEFLGLRRAATERKDMANPMGIGGEHATSTLDALRARVGDEGYAALEDTARAFWALRNKYIIPRLRESGIFSDELMQRIEDNENYATFSVQDFLDEQYGAGSVGAAVYRQIGTLKEITNPLTATIVKDISLLHAAYMNDAKRAAIDTSGAVQAKTRFNGKYMEPIETRDRARRLMLVSEKGQIKGYYVPREVADYFKRDEFGASILYNVMRLISNPVKRVFTVNNPAFGLWNLQRDFRSMMKNLPGNALTQPFKMVKAYKQTFVTAFLDALFGKSTPFAERMYRANLLIAGRSFRADEFINEDTELDRIMAEWDRNPRARRNFFLKAGKAVFNDFNQSLERWSKAAGAKYLENQGYSLDDPKVRQMVRERAGSPDFLERGKYTPWTNMIFLFSNAQIQGVRATVHAIKDNPINYPAKLFLYDVLPKLVQVAAARGILDMVLGALGFYDDDDDRPIQRMMENIPQRDRDNYLTIPLGFTEDNKTLYAVMPQDFTGQFVGNLISAVLDTGASPSDVTSVVASQSPYGLGGLNPVLENLYYAAAYAVGQNPVDMWAGKPVLSETEFKAGGAQAWEEIGVAAWNNVLGTSLWRLGKPGAKTGPSSVEQISAMPVIGPVLRRVLRVSSRGQDDALNDVLEQTEKQEAQISLRIGEWIEKDLESFTEMPSNPRARTMAGIRAYRRAKKAGVMDDAYDRDAFAQRYSAALMWRFGTSMDKAEMRAGRIGKQALEGIGE